MTQTYKERAEALQISAPTNWPMGAQSDYHTGGWRVRAAAAELCAEADASLAIKDAEIAAMAAEVARLREETQAAKSRADSAVRTAAKLMEKRIALLKDADRYRWMRRSLYWDGHAWWIPDLPVSSPDVQSGTHDEVPYPTDAEIDASIDAEIEHDRAASKKG